MRTFARLERIEKIVAIEEMILVPAAEKLSGRALGAAGYGAVHFEK